MKMAIMIANGVMIGICGYSILHDWQAWALILWFVFAVNLYADSVRTGR